MNRRDKQGRFLHRLGKYFGREGVGTFRLMRLSEAKNLSVGDIVWFIDSPEHMHNARRAKVNGRVKRWKRSPDRVEIPFKWNPSLYGLYDYFTVDWHSSRKILLTEVL